MKPKSVVAIDKPAPPVSLPSQAGVGNEAGLFGQTGDNLALVGSNGGSR
ncbi:MAG: hypothetical protein KIS67_16710 [Verrucomicrobiae bacterium]|nr:hypothetical protein [Verrucomicrobiae bacterium]